ncbi:MAG: endonuclease/exonuclease/phosphatase family protein [Enterobacterales bacterium]|nr:endonuclease/exonuclease/phosphatase family protein [Enterobacterales bacterium]
MSYNVQVGIDSASYGDYITQSWRHLLPDSKRAVNLARIASWLSEFDVVALQEVDAGSLRSGFINQVNYLADLAGFPHCHQQQNRRVAGIAAHSNGILSKYASTQVIHHKLPSRIPGRGALELTLESGGVELLIVSVHLSLSHRARCLQLEYIAQLVKNAPHFVLMGDMNCPPSVVAKEFAKLGVKVKQGNKTRPTFPRWKPRHSYDQIWVSEDLKILGGEVLNYGVSDHLPISLEIEIPSWNEQDSYRKDALCSAIGY